MKVRSFKHSPYCTSSSKFLCFNVPLLARIRTSSILILPDFTQFMTFSCISLLSCRNNESLSQELWLFLRQAHAVSMQHCLVTMNSLTTNCWNEEVYFFFFMLVHIRMSCGHRFIWHVVALLVNLNFLLHIIEPDNVFLFCLMSSAVNQWGRLNALICSWKWEHSLFVTNSQHYINLQPCQMFLTFDTHFVYLNKQFVYFYLFYFNKVVVKHTLFTEYLLNKPVIKKKKSQEKVLTWGTCTVFLLSMLLHWTSGDQNMSDDPSSVVK